MELQPISIRFQSGIAGNFLFGDISHTPFAGTSLAQSTHGAARGLIASIGTDDANSPTTLTPSTTRFGLFPMAAQRSLAIGTGQLTGTGALSGSASPPSVVWARQRDMVGVLTAALQSYNNTSSASIRTGMSSKEMAPTLRAGSLNSHSSSVFQSLFA